VIPARSDSNDNTESYAGAAVAGGTFLIWEVMNGKEALSTIETFEPNQEKN